MEPHKESPNIRTGRFLWMDEAEKKRYLSDLRNRIEQGFFYRDTVVMKIVDDIAPVMDDCIEGELTYRY